MSTAQTDSPRTFDAGSFFFGCLMAFDFTGIIGGEYMKRINQEFTEKINARIKSMRERYRPLPTPEEAIRGDWERIGNDMRKAMKTVDLQLASNKQIS